jgi:hypothetical protein
MRETPSPEYPNRTRWNVRDADATLILSRGPADRGTALTKEIAQRMHKPLLIIDLDKRLDLPAIREWLASHAVNVLNIAGPRESSQPGIYAAAYDILRQVLGPSPNAPLQ